VFIFDGSFGLGLPKCASSISMDRVENIVLYVEDVEIKDDNIPYLIIEKVVVKVKIGV